MMWIVAVGSFIAGVGIGGFLGVAVMVAYYADRVECGRLHIDELAINRPPATLPGDAVRVVGEYPPIDGLDERLAQGDK